MINPQSPVPGNDPLMVAWKAYIATKEFKNSKHWALCIRPMVQQVDSPEAERADYEIMTFKQRERHVMGSLWAAFAAGFASSTESETPEQAKPPFPREWDVRPYQRGEDMTGISVSASDTVAGSPKFGDMIARNPKNHTEQWLVTAKYFADNFEPLP